MKKSPIRLFVGRRQGTKEENRHGPAVDHDAIVQFGAIQFHGADRAFFQVAVKPLVLMLAHLAHPHVLQVVKHRVRVVKQHVQRNAHLHAKHRVDLDVLIDAQINVLVALAHAVLDALLHAFLVVAVHVILDVVDLVKDLVSVVVKILARLHVIPNVLQDAKVAVTHLVKTPVELVALTDVLIVA